MTLFSWTSSSFNVSNIGMHQFMHRLQCCGNYYITKSPWHTKQEKKETLTDKQKISFHFHPSSCLRPLVQSHSVSDVFKFLSSRNFTWTHKFSPLQFVFAQILSQLSHLVCCFLFSTGIKTYIYRSGSKFNFCLLELPTYRTYSHHSNHQK